MKVFSLGALASSSVMTFLRLFNANLCWSCITAWTLILFDLPHFYVF